MEQQSLRSPRLSETDFFFVFMHYSWCFVIEFYKKYYLDNFLPQSSRKNALGPNLDKNVGDVTL